jgi:hypothetical protein
MALYERAAAEAPDWARSELAKVAQATVSRGPFEVTSRFARVKRANRSDAERHSDGKKAAMDTVEARLAWVPKHIKALRQNSEGTEPIDNRFELLITTPRPKVAGGRTESEQR